MRSGEFFMKEQASQARPPFCWNHACGMIGKSGEDGDFVSGFDPMAGELGGASGRGAHLWGEVL